MLECWDYDSWGLVLEDSNSIAKTPNFSLNGGYKLFKTLRIWSLDIPGTILSASSCSNILHAHCSKEISFHVLTFGCLYT